MKYSELQTGCKILRPFFVVSPRFASAWARCRSEQNDALVPIIPANTLNNWSHSSDGLKMRKAVLMVWISLLVQGQFVLYLNTYLACFPKLTLLFSALLLLLSLSVSLCSGSLCPQTSERPDGGLLQRPETCRRHRRSLKCLPPDHTVTDQRHGE